MAHIDVLTARPIGTVDRRIFGGVAEHLGRCVQGGLIAEEPPAGLAYDEWNVWYRAGDRWPPFTVLEMQLA